MLKFYSIKVIYIYILLALIYRQKTGEINTTETNENENKSAFYYVRVVACKYFTQQGSKLFQEVIVFFVLIHENKNNFQII